jgi:hypothetical protein
MNRTETELGLGFPSVNPGFNQNQNDSGPLKYEARGEWHTPSQALAEQPPFYRGYPSGDWYRANGY